MTRNDLRPILLTLVALYALSLAFAPFWGCGPLISIGLPEEQTVILNRTTGSNAPKKRERKQSRLSTGTQRIICSRMPRNTSGWRATPKSGKLFCSMPFGGVGEFTDAYLWRAATNLTPPRTSMLPTTFFPPPRGLPANMFSPSRGLAE